MLHALILLGVVTIANEIDVFSNTFINKKENKIHHHIIDIRVTRVQK
jgi:hypothetical protein